MILLLLAGIGELRQGHISRTEIVSKCLLWLILLMLPESISPSFSSR